MVRPPMPGKQLVQVRPINGLSRKKVLTCAGNVDLDVFVVCHVERYCTESNNAEDIIRKRVAE